MTDALKVLILDDRSSDADHTAKAFERAGVSVVTRWAATRPGFSQAIHEFTPDVVLSELALGSFTAKAAIEILRTLRPITPLVVVSAHMDASDAVEAIRYGAADVVPKSRLDRLPAVVSAAIESRRPLHALSPRQFQVLRLIAEGHTTREIARRLRVSVKTAETHRTGVMKRLGFHEVVSLVRYAIRTGTVTIHD